MRALVEQVRIACAEDTPVRRLWIVEPGRIRMHLPTGARTDDGEE
jgi:hypothetical protein